MTLALSRLSLKGHKDIVVINAPPSFDERLATLEDVVVHRDPSRLDRVGFAIAFVTTEEEIAAAADAILPKAEGDPVLWFAYPSNRSKRHRCEFDRDKSWAPVRAVGFEDGRQVALDEDWTILRFRRPEHKARVFNPSQLTELRTRRGWSQQELASRAKVTPSFISKLEKYRIEQPSMRHLQKVADALQIPLTSLMNRPTRYRSVFISYGGPDEIFARALYDALTKHGVETFFFPESAVPGQRLHRTMAQGVEEYDHVLLICSGASLDRWGVLTELEYLLAREARQGGAELLIPIAIDDFVFKHWRPEREDVGRQVRDRVIADFRGVLTSTPDFETRVSRILRALEK